MIERTDSRYAVIGLGLALLVFAAFSQFKLPVVLPLLLDRYAYDPVLAGGFMSVYAALGIGLSIWIGRRAEGGGPLPLVLLALPLMAAGTLISLSAPQSGMTMLLGRGLEGAAFAILAVAGATLATSAAAPRHRALVIGLVAAWMPAGQLLAALLAPLALAAGDWSLLWQASIALAALLTVWSWAVKRQAAKERKQENDRSPGKTTATPQPWSAAQRRGLLLTAAVFMLWSGQYLAYMTWLPEYLVEALGIPVETALWIYLVPVVFVALFNVATGFMLRSGIAVERLLLGAVVVQALLWWLLPVSSSGIPGLLSLVVYGVTAGIVPTCLFALPTVLTVGPGQTARAFGAIMTGRNLGVLMGPLLLAQVVKWSSDWIASSLVFGLLTTGAAALAALLILIAPRVRGELIAAAEGTERVYGTGR
ncbi:MFS transporter [Pelagibius litoralis]|uniref:MFS transporter n=1 Tax=Pelagibius litoralis TaxID=374515 RepID=A0A967F240_9PROT|nr:MFS transporter [Pelagibius litoralis]NIA71675.1 MFS transporter [Pelagibius litoralis]